MSSLDEQTFETQPLSDALRKTLDRGLGNVKKDVENSVLEPARQRLTILTDFVDDLLANDFSHLNIFERTLSVSLPLKRERGHSPKRISEILHRRFWTILTKCGFENWFSGNLTPENYLMYYKDKSLVEFDFRPDMNSYNVEVAIHGYCIEWDGKKYIRDDGELALGKKFSEPSFEIRETLAKMGVTKEARKKFFKAAASALDNQEAESVSDTKLDTLDIPPLTIPNVPPKYLGRLESGDIFDFLLSGYKYEQGGQPLTLAYLRNNDPSALAAFRSRRRSAPVPPALRVLEVETRGQKTPQLLRDHNIDLSSPEGIADAKRVMSAIGELIYKR